MIPAVEYSVNIASCGEIAEHLSRCDGYFVPSLSARVEIPDYAEKIEKRAMRFEAWSGGTLVGMLAAYFNVPTESYGFITSVSVLNHWAGRGIAACMLEQCVEHARMLGLQGVQLEVGCDNLPAIRLYLKVGFVEVGVCPPFTRMMIDFNERKPNEPTT